MADDTISLHLSESETTISSSTLHGLACQNLHRASASGVDFIVYHVFEALIVGWVQEDVGFQLPPCVAIVHDLQEQADLEPLKYNLHFPETCIDLLASHTSIAFNMLPQITKKSKHGGL